MTRRRLRVWAVGLCAILLAACSDDPAITAPPPATPSPPPPERHAAERAALMALYDATGGTHWREQGNWNTARIIQNWRGVRTNSAGFVTELLLPNNNLTGTLPPELGDLPQLRRLVLRANNLSGTLPRELGRLSQLTMLDLSRNSLEGTIPSDLGSLSRLDSLLLRGNELTGPIPRELGNLGSLRRLQLSSNQLSGPVPPELGKLANLTNMNLSRNELTAAIPPELAKLGAIRILSVSRNNLTGMIPPELGDLAALESLYLYENQLTGGIPVSLTNLSELETLWIQDNGLSGPLIGELTNLQALEDLRAAGNQLSGRLPRDLGSLQALTRLELEGNRDLAGLLPRSMTGLEFLRTLSYGATDLCAQVDHEFQEWLRTIPEVSRRDCDVRQVERLALTDLYDATGGPSWVNRSAWGTDAPLGAWHGVSTQDGGVVEVALSGNGLTGPLPPEIANLTELRVVDLAENDLSGAFPRSIAGLRELAELRLDRNPGLEGALPFAFRKLPRVRVLLHDDTGLCASPAPDFQAWYTAIEQTAGAICENPDQVTVSLPMVYLTQSVQAASGHVRLVASRDALLRAFVTAEGPRGFFEPEVVAVFTGPDGGEVHRVVMTRDANQIPAEAEEGDLGQSYNAVIPAEVIVPGVEMVVRIDPGGALPLTAESETRFPEEGPYSPNVVEVPPMQLTLVPVMDAAKPDTSVLEWVSGISADSPEVGLLRHAFPFAEFSVVQRSPYFTSLDPTTESGRIALMGEIEMLRAAEGGTGHYYGVVASLGSIAGWAQRPGWVSVGIARPTTLAHEVGHNLSLRHAPCGDPGNVDPEFPYPGRKHRRVGIRLPQRIDGASRPRPGHHDLLSVVAMAQRLLLRTSDRSSRTIGRGRTPGRTGPALRQARALGRSPGRRALDRAGVLDARGAAAARGSGSVPHSGDHLGRRGALLPGLHAHRGRIRGQALLLRGADPGRMGGRARTHHADGTGRPGLHRPDRRAPNHRGQGARDGTPARDSPGLGRIAAGGAA